ncbi:MAG TPA: sodium:solute symporter [bacterium]|nr:sodium:solute symporter [bacterium]
MVENGLHFLDFLFVVVFLGIMIGMGVYFARKSKTKDSYYLGNKAIPAWAIGLSILATLISSVTYLAYPGEGFDSNWIRLVQGLMVPIVLVSIIWIIVPLYRKVIGVSTYEFFEKRFGYLARVYGSLAFLFAHFSKMGTVFYLISLALATMLGVNIYLIIWILGVSVIVYTLVGGIEGVIWSDVLQGGLLVIGGLFTVVILLFGTRVGPAGIMQTAFASGKIDFGPYNWGFVKLTFWVMAINGIFYALQKYGTDQTIVQRYLSARTDKEGVRASLIGVLMSAGVWTLFMFIGTLLWSYYHVSADQLPDGIRPDAVFPHFIMTELPPGVAGIILAGLIGAALSSLDSDLNSLSAVVVEDYYIRLKQYTTDRGQLILGRLVVLITGLISLGIASWYVTAGEETALSIVFTLYAIFSGGIAGLFLLGVFTTHANRKGVYTGIIACILFSAYGVLTSTHVTIGGEARLLLDLGKYNYPHHQYMLGVYSHIVLFVVAYIASYFFSQEKNIYDLTYYEYRDRRRERKAREKTND